ncbi:phosphopyruvate hydratase [Acidipropionibacterium virtanenii]|uniref:Enolase n=1 Tax=Acidipropionibacterium virtanenii TaxID=2057246 RepID=A0A344UX11_9ACTN|nr:phosphopyruvate hydratase [Acidipropionibacterium virtanenii]AXE39809.1 Enolase [Acidipropionibacterium virtanenii]
MPTITTLNALEILDSRSRPTVKVVLTLDDGTRAQAQVPSGASTGTREAVELRDGDQSRYRGLGVRTAVANVTGPIAREIIGRPFDSLETLDRALIALDGTEHKSGLGANAILGVSMAFARALATSAGQELFEFLPSVGSQTPRMPVPCFNVLNGGVHAANPLDFQEFMICPLGAPTMAEAVRAGSEIYGALRSQLADAGHPVGLGDEGGFAPDIAQPEEVLDVIVAAIRAAGYTPGRDGVAIAMDPASSEFRADDGTYVVAGEHFTSDQMIDRYQAIVDSYPVWLLEDGLAEDDWDGWARLTGRLGDRIELVGDDIFCTNPAIIGQGIEKGVASASLIKLNQIGSVSETLEAMRVCADAGYRQFMSHRSGETPDTFIADLAVATGCGHIKAGAPARGERVAKYNRLIEISAAHPELPYGLPD